MTQFLCLCLFLICSVIPASAVDDPREVLPDPAQERLAEKIGAELRCLVCQNESIEDSSASLARDLRRIVRQQVAQGKSKGEVVDWMTQRYGDFVRLKPRFSASTAFLWLTPIIALAVGIFFANCIFRRRHPAIVPLSEEERARLKLLVSDNRPVQPDADEAEK